MNHAPRRAAAIVTGGASGIGFALVRQISIGGGCALAVDIDPSGAAAVEAVGGRFMAADVSRPADWERAVQVAADELGGLDLLVLNAGTPVLDPDVVTVPYERISRAYAVNVEGVVHGLRAGVPLLEAGGGGDIVIVASLAGIMAYPDDPYYAMTKHAVVGLGLSAARSLAARDIRVSIFCPGAVDTPMLPERVRSAVDQAGLELLSPQDAAAQLLAAVDEGGTGRIWTGQAHLGLVEYLPTRVELPRPAVRTGRR